MLGRTGLNPNSARCSRPSAHNCANASRAGVREIPKRADTFGSVSRVLNAIRPFISSSRNVAYTESRSPGRAT